MKTYITQTHVTHDNVPYVTGSEIELDDKHAEPLLACGAVLARGSKATTSKPDKPAPKPRKARQAKASK